MSSQNSLTDLVIREAPVELTFSEKGKPVARKGAIRFVSSTVKQLREQQSLFKARKEAGEMVFISEVLSPRVREFVYSDEKGNEVVIKLTPELLDEMAIDNLKAIEKAIDEATDPKSE